MARSFTEEFAKLQLRALVRLGWVTLIAAGFVTDCFAADIADEPEPKTLTGAWEPRLRLETNGVTPYANLVTEGWANVNGGLETGAVGSSFLDFGLEADTEKLWGWKGGAFHAEGHWVENVGGRPFEGKTGAFAPISGLAAASQIRVYNLFYRQSMMQDRLTIKGGQIAADEDFMLSEYARLFLNSSFGAMPSQVDSPQFPVWPVAAPGFVLKWAPREPLHIQVGVYHGRPGDDVPDNHGFDWASQSGPGVSVLYESGYTFCPFGRKVAIRLGGTYHSGESSDYERMNAGNPDALDSGIPSFYAIQDWTLIKDKDGSPRLGVFWRGGFKPNPEQQLVGAYSDAGLNWFAPIPGRDQDVAGIAVAWTEFGREYRRYTGWQVPANEQTIELTYKAQVTRWFSLQGDLQWLVNPAGGTGNPTSATVIGLRATAAF